MSPSRQLRFTRTTDNDVKGDFEMVQKLNHNRQYRLRAYPYCFTLHRRLGFNDSMKKDFQSMRKIHQILIMRSEGYCLLDLSGTEQESENVVQEQMGLKGESSLTSIFIHRESTYIRGTSKHDESQIRSHCSLKFRPNDDSLVHEDSLALSVLEIRTHKVLTKWIKI